MEKKNLRIVFMGTPEFAVGSLQRLVENGYNVVAVVTQPDKPVGRHGSVLRPSPVKEYALAHGLPVLQPLKMKDEHFLEQLRSYNADLQVVVAFRMLPEVVWAMPRFGTFNVHAALLPDYRGAAPINWAVINGETLTGVTTFFLDHDIDTGRIIAQRQFPIPDDADVEYVYDGLMQLGAQLCTHTVDLVLSTDGNAPSQPQQESDAHHAAPKIFKETCAIDFSLPAKRIYDFVRGLSPLPGAWCLLTPRDAQAPAQVLKIYKTAKTGEPSAGGALVSSAPDYKTATAGEPSAGGALVSSAPDNKAAGGALVSSAPDYKAVKTDDQPTGVEVGTLKAENRRLLVATVDEWLEIVELQPAGKKRMAARDFLNGFQHPEHFLLK
ncbi:methionyl-tRNA formyltransferase [Leyella stercorea]